jgi:hypothetical protein
METKAEQHHEHLTEAEKKISAKIMSVAATLYEKVMIPRTSGGGCAQVIPASLCSLTTLRSN